MGDYDHRTSYDCLRTILAKRRGKAVANFTLSGDLEMAFAQSLGNFLADVSTIVFILRCIKSSGLEPDFY